MNRTRNPFFVFATLIALVTTIALPTRVSADDTPPTPDVEAESGAEFEDTEVESDIPGVEVLITDEAGEIVPIDSLAGEEALLNGEPVWCPEDQTPMENGEGCTAPYGSIGDLLTDISDDTSGEDGTIYIQTTSAEVIEVSEMPSADVVVEIVQTDIETNLGVLVGGEVQPIGDVDSVVSDPIDDPLFSDESIDTSCLTENGMDGETCSEGAYQIVAEAVIVGEEISVEENQILEDQTDAMVPDPASDDRNLTDPMIEDPSVSSNEVDLAMGGIEVDPILNNTESLVVPALEDPSTLSEALIPDEQEQVERDPIWCPDGSIPTPGSFGCTASFNTLGELVTYLMNHQPTQNGTIWIQEGDDASVGPIGINGAIASTWANYALTLNGGWSGIPGDSNIIGSTTFSRPIEIIGWQNDVSINDIIIQNTNGIGLLVEIDGDIALENVSSNGNFDYGAVLVNCEYTKFGCAGGETNTVTLTGTNSFNDNGSTSWGADGLFILSDSDIYLNNITANNNEMDFDDIGGTGLYVSSTTGDIVLTGTNTFNGNTETGAQFSTGGGGNIYLENLNVNTSMWNGVGVVLGSGNAYVGGNNTFENTRGDAIIILSEGDIFASNINTNNTGGIHLETSNGSVSLTGSNYFNNTIYQGHVVFIQASNDVFVEGVTSVNGDNGDGVKIGAGGDVTINCTHSANNNQYGLEVGFDDWITGQPLYYPDTLTLNNVTFSNNASGDYLVNGSSTTVTVNPGFPCYQPSSYEDSLSDVVKPSNSNFQNPLPLNVVSLVDTGLSTPLVLDCTQYSGFVLSLANGDSVSYPCPASGNVNLLRVNAGPGQLPDDLPPGLTFISGMTSSLTGSTGGIIKTSFVIPADKLNSILTVLFWDGAALVDLSTAVFTDGKLVYNRGEKTANGTYQIETNFTGTFILVSR